MSSSAEARFGAAARHAAAEWGLPEPQLVRVGMNGVFLAGDDVVLRVSHDVASAERSLRLAVLLTEAGVRVPRPRRPGVLCHAGVAVAAVERLHAAGRVDWQRVGADVAAVHRLDPATVAAAVPLPWCGDFPWWQFEAGLDDVAGEVDGPALAALRAVVDRGLPLLDATRRGPGVVCHGDVHPGNVVPTAEGPVLLDWDMVCRGPAAWDHAALLTWTERWGGEPGVYEAFAAGYGVSLRTDPLGEALAALRLVAATVMRVQAGRHEPAAAAEAARRLRWWRGEPDAPAWTPA